MLEGGKIDSKQAIFLLTTMVLATAILFVPAIIAHHAKQDAWISAILATLGGLVIARLQVTLGLRFPGMTLFQYLEVILGKVLGKAAGFLYLWWFLHMNAEVLREFGSFLVAAFMPDTPIIVFIIIITIISAYAVRSGLEVFTRVNQIILPLILLSLLVLFALAIKEMRITRLLPLLDTGVVPIIKGALTPLSWFGEMATFLMIIPYLNKPQEAPRIANTAILISGTFFLITVLGVLAIFGPALSARWMFPTLNGARMIHLANFLERLEAVIMVIWVFGAFVKISVFYYAGVLGSAQLLGLKDFRPLVLPIGVIVVALSILLHPNILDLAHFLGQVWPPYALSTFEVGLPLILLAISLIRGKGGQQQ